MLSVKIPFLEELGNSVFQRNIELLRQRGAKVAIDKNSWSDKYPYTPDVKAYLGYDNEGVMVLYDVVCIGLRTMSPCDGNYVHEDSCVEFFMQKEKGSCYINIEFNAFGVCYASRHSTPKESIPFTKDEYNSIIRFATVKEHGVSYDTEHRWSLAFKAPWYLLQYKEGEIPEKFYANLYKCGDKTAIPHFLSWNNIVGYDIPTFHCPENFGLVETV